MKNLLNFIQCYTKIALRLFKLSPKYLYIGVPGYEAELKLKVFKNLKDLNKNKYDFVFYVAGVDIHFNDRLGKLKITDDGVNKRDQIVIENFYSKNTPLCGVLGGGYNKSFEKLIELHSMLHKNCARII